MPKGLTPIPTPETEPFWAGAKEGSLLLQQCNSCGKFYFYPRPFCRYCWSTDVEWRTTSGKGRLLSYIINYRPLPPSSDSDHEPQVIAIVELDEGPRLMTNIVGVEPSPENLPLDAPVEVEFEDREGQALPLFHLASPA